MENKKLKQFEKYIKTKRVAIIGMGISNIPLLDYFYDLHVCATVFDTKQISQINPKAIQKIEKYGFDFISGKNALDKLIGFDIIFRSPSCMPDIPQIATEVERGAILTSEIEMVLKLAPCKIIGVTGTEGKTTTTSLINCIIQKSGKKCFLGGNIGKPIFTQIKDMTEDDVVVVELSSFQLTDINVSPNISVITNIYPDHLNVHKSYEEYQEAKKNIFKYQSENEIVVLNYDNEITKEFTKDVKGKTIFFSSNEKLENGYIYDKMDKTIKYCEDGIRRHIVKKDDIKLRGIHNYENICAAFAATKTIADIDTQIEAVKEFYGVEHRLEFVKELDGVKWYNDSIGTSPPSTIAGLNSFDEDIVLLAGGSDKGLDYKEVGEAIAKKVRVLILTGPTTEKIEKATKKALEGKTVEIYYTTNMKESVNLAKELAVKGDIVLLSPASASFDLYKNFEDRGNQFKECVNSLS